MLNNLSCAIKFKIISLPLTASALLSAGNSVNHSARLVDLIKPAPEDRILYIGPGYYAEPLLACAFYGATVDVVQPQTQSSLFGPPIYQTSQLENNLNSLYVLLNDIYGDNIIKGKLNLRTHEGFLQDSKLNLKYSLFFLLNVLDSSEALGYGFEICNKLFDYSEHVSSIIISAWEQKSSHVAGVVAQYANNKGIQTHVFRLYEPVDSLEFPHGVYRVLLINNR